MKIAILGLIALAAFGQEFEAVSIKPTTSATGGSHSRGDAGMITATNQSLKRLIMRAYGVPEYRVEGPDWLDTTSFDIVARFPEALSANRAKYEDAMQAMMQKMLADRFHIVVHRTSKEFPVYGLLAAKRGARLKDGANCDGEDSRSEGNHYAAKCVSMRAFAVFLSRRSDLPVLDMTGLSGAYDFTMDWVDEPKGAPDDPAVTPFVVALDKLGLRLENRKASMDVVVIDHIDKAPTEN